MVTLLDFGIVLIHKWIKRSCSDAWARARTILTRLEPQA